MTDIFKESKINLRWLIMENKIRYLAYSLLFLNIFLVLYFGHWIATFGWFMAIFIFLSANNIMDSYERRIEVYQKILESRIKEKERILERLRVGKI